MNVIQHIVKDLIEHGINQGEHINGIRDISEITKSVSSTMQISSTVINEEDAEVYLRTCIENVHEKAKTNPIADWSQYRWTWYLRRFPDKLLAGMLETTEPYNKILMESLAAFIAADRKPTSVNEKGIFPLNVNVGNKLARFTGFVIGLSQLLVLYRMCGKGAPLILDSDLHQFDLQFPEADPSGALVEAMNFYDQRATDTRHSGQVGVPVITIDESKIESPVLIGVGRIENAPKLLPFPLPDTTGKIWANFRPIATNVEKFHLMLQDPLLNRPSLWNEDLPVLLAALIFGVYILGKLDAIDQANVLQSGYLIYGKDSYQALWDRSREHVLNRAGEIISRGIAKPIGDIDDILQALSQVRGSLWPPRNGKLAFPAFSNQYVIDLHGATVNLFRSLQFPRAEGKLANIRAKRFEKITQVAINETAWKPPDPLSILVNKDLKKKGDSEPFGEIDALAIKNGIGILVSCKSILYGDDYDRGEYSAVRNGRTNIEEAIKEWRALIDTIKSNPQGANYDFRSLENITGVVISPYPVFIEEPILSSTVLPGLREYSTFEELVSWLSSPSSQNIETELLG